MNDLFVKFNYWNTQMIFHPNISTLRICIALWVQAVTCRFIRFRIVLYDMLYIFIDLCHLNRQKNDYLFQSHILIGLVLMAMHHFID